MNQEKNPVSLTTSFMLVFMVTCSVQFSIHDQTLPKCQICFETRPWIDFNRRVRPEVGKLGSQGQIEFPPVFVSAVRLFLCFLLLCCVWLLSCTNSREDYWQQRPSVLQSQKYLPSEPLQKRSGFRVWGNYDPSLST